MQQMKYDYSQGTKKRNPMYIANSKNNLIINKQDEIETKRSKSVMGKEYGGGLLN